MTETRILITSTIAAGGGREDPLIPGLESGANGRCQGGIEGAGRQGRDQLVALPHEAHIGRPRHGNAYIRAERRRDHRPRFGFEGLELPFEGIPIEAVDPLRDGAHPVDARRRQQQAERRGDARTRRADHPVDAEPARQLAAMQRPAAAGDQQREVAGVMTLLRDMHARRRRHGLRSPRHGCRTRPRRGRGPPPVPAHPPHARRRRYRAAWPRRRRSRHPGSPAARFPSVTVGSAPPRA